MSFTTVIANQLLNLVLRGTAWTPPSALYLSLHTADPGDTGANEIVGGGYRRQRITFDAAADKTSPNSGALDFPGMPACTVTHVALWAVATAGQCLWTGALVTPEPVNIGNTFHFDRAAVEALFS